MDTWRPWHEKRLSTNHRFAFGWAEGYTFHRVLSREYTRLENFVGSGAISAELLAAGAAANPSNRESFIIRDSDGNYLEDVTSAQKENIIQQIFYGFNPPWLRIFVSYPADTRLGKIPSFPPQTPDSNYGFITGEDSPFETPTEAGEFWFPYKMRIQFDFANPRTDRRAHPSVHAEIFKYKVQHLNPTDPMDAPLIAKMARGDAQVSWISLGPVAGPKSFEI